jgi:hypothetical protein
LRERRLISNLLLSSTLAVVFFLFLTWTSSSITAGDDAYRHVRFANRLATTTRDALADPWRLPYFWPKPLDVWFGYHLLLAPLTLLLPLIPAAKLLGSLVWGGTAFVLQQFCEMLGIRWARTWVILAMCGSAIVLYRATLVRPFLFSLLLLILATRFVIEERPLALAVSALVHALSYSIFFLPALPVALNLVIRRNRRSLILAAACGLGLALGLIVNPFFAENVKFSFAQVLTPLAQGSADLFDIGMEVRPITVWWLAVTIPILAAWLTGVAVLLARLRTQRPSAAQLVLFSLSVVLLIGSFRVSRTIDLFVPFAVLFAASVISPWLEQHRVKAQLAFGFLYLLSAIALIPTFSTIRSSPSITLYEGASAFLSHEAPNQIVLNTHWEQYPFLYFWNWQSRYVTGIDPTFLYRNSASRYWLWRHMSDDAPATCAEQTCEGRPLLAPEEAAIREFGARFIVVEQSKNPKLLTALRASSKAREAYQDSYLSVFEMLEASPTN